MEIKNKKGGIVTSTIYGVGGLVLATIIILVVVSTILDADLFTSSKATTTYVNQTLAVVNFSYSTPFGDYTKYNPSCSVTEVFNATGGQVIDSGNYTLDGCYIQAVATTQFNNVSWNVSSSTTYAGSEEYTSTDLTYNMTSGINNISSKIPTILLIVAVVFLFGALVLLIRQSQMMGIGTSTGSSL